MPKSEERMNMISVAIRNQAQQQRDEIIKKANELRDNALKEYTGQVVDRMYVKAQHDVAAIEQDKLADISEAEQDAFHKLLTRRSELVAELFATVRDKLAAYTATPAYKEWLLTGIRTLADKYDHNQSRVELRAEDMAFADEIKAALPGAAVEAGDVLVGGFILHNAKARVRIDETLQTRLDEQRPWFLEHCNLRVTKG